MKATKTLQLIDQAITSNSSSNHRTHLGGSLIGEPCLRKLWYIFRWAQKPSFPARVLRLFDRGHREEERFVKWLKDAGIQVWDVAEDNKQFRISDHGGHFGGSLDGIALGVPEVPQGIYAVLEFKTHSDKYFKLLAKNGVKEAQPKHYAQMQVYMRKQGLDYCLYVGVNKNDDSLYCELVELDVVCADEYLNIAYYVITTDVAPARINDRPTFFDCKWCDFKDICHNSKPAEVNCRTCKNCYAGDNKEWYCKLGASVPDNLHTGCSNHRFFPEMVGDIHQEATRDSNELRATLLRNMENV